MTFGMVDSRARLSSRVTTERMRSAAIEDPDAELVERWKGGDELAFEALIRRHQQRVFRLLLRMMGTREEAEDVCQEAFLRAYRALRGFRGQAKFSSWLYRITLNLCRDWIRRERRTPMSHQRIAA